MNIFSLDPLVYGVAFFAAPILFLIVTRFMKPKTEKDVVKTGPQIIKALLLVFACLACLFSFVMFWDKLVGGPLLLCVSIPLSLLITFAIWRIGITLLLAESGVTVVETTETKRMQSILVVGPMAERFASTPDDG